MPITGIFIEWRSKMRYALEIRAAEGGEDSKLFVNDLAKSYLKMVSRHG